MKIKKYVLYRIKNQTASISHDTEKKIGKILGILLKPFICKPAAPPRVWQAMQDKGVLTFGII
nr:MAG TPA: hypothetical protein [Bacteriophage sp.]